MIAANGFLSVRRNEEIASPDLSRLAVDGNKWQNKFDRKWSAMHGTLSDVPPIFFSSKEVYVAVQCYSESFDLDKKRREGKINLMRRLICQNMVILLDGLWMIFLSSQCYWKSSDDTFLFRFFSKLLISIQNINFFFEFISIKIGKGKKR